LKQERRGKKEEGRRNKEEGRSFFSPEFAFAFAFNFVSRFFGERP